MFNFKNKTINELHDMFRTYACSDFTEGLENDVEIATLNRAEVEEALEHIGYVYPLEDLEAEAKGYL